MKQKDEKKEYEKKFHSQEFYEYLVDNGLILFETIIGSQAYGTATPASDVDKKFVYILPEDFILGMGYIEQININADYVGYEIKRFLELIELNNPTLLELVASPKDMIIHKDPLFDLILEQKDKFITKICKNSFGGYARQQIQKAKGQDKMMNWEANKVTRKTPLDFCFVVHPKTAKTSPLTDYLEAYGIDQRFCGLAKIPNARDMYYMHYDVDAHYAQPYRDMVNDGMIDNSEFMSKIAGLDIKGYKGIIKENKDGKLVSNELRLSSIGKDVEDKVLISYNKDGYISHCKDYNQYQHWLETRNEQRWVDVEGHGQKIDGKNMMHCIRLINVSKEIARGEGIIVKRPEAKYLLDIRHGKVDLDSLITEAEKSIKEMDKLFDESDLPNKVDPELVDNLLITIRKEKYGHTYL